MERYRLFVGGTHCYDVSRSTLVSRKGSMLAVMFGGCYALPYDNLGRVLLPDRNGEAVGHVLSFMATGTLPPAGSLQAVRREADYFMLSDLLAELDTYRVSINKKICDEYAGMFANYRRGFHEIVLKIKEARQTAALKWPPAESSTITVMFAIEAIPEVHEMEDELTELLNECLVRHKCGESDDIVIFKLTGQMTTAINPRMLADRVLTDLTVRGYGATVSVRPCGVKMTAAVTNGGETKGRVVTCRKPVCVLKVVAD